MPSSILKHHPFVSTASCRFGMRLQNGHYDEHYLTGNSYNGTVPDSFALQALQYHCPKPDKATIWDIGAGDGRNTLPLAEAGYSVIASEISRNGAKRIRHRVKHAGLEERIQVDSVNILDPAEKKKRRSPVNPTLATPVNAAILSRISMHFSLAEMKQVFENVYDKLAPGGIFILNALIRRPDYDKIQKPLYDMELEGAGCNNFDEGELIQAAKDSRFQIEIIQDHEPPKKGDPRYRTHIMWGEEKGNETSFFKCPPPVWLKWFLLRKPDTPPKRPAKGVR